MIIFDGHMLDGKNPTNFEHCKKIEIKNQIRPIFPIQKDISSFQNTIINSTT